VVQVCVYKYIFLGFMQFMVLWMIELTLITVFPQIALWLSILLYGQYFILV